ncbi:hypothetical protein ScPMuIL_014310 [Solemya velum]
MKTCRFVMMSSKKMRQISIASTVVVILAVLCLYRLHYFDNGAAKMVYNTAEKSTQMSEHREKDWVVTQENQPKITSNYTTNYTSTIENDEVHDISPADPYEIVTYSHSSNDSLSTENSNVDIHHTPYSNNNEDMPVYPESRPGSGDIKIHQRSPGKSKSRKYMIYSCTDDYCGGLSDRMKGIVLTYLIANLTGRTFGVNINTSDCDFAHYFDEKSITWNIGENFLTGNFSVHRYRHVDDKIFRKTLSVIDLDKYFRHDVILFSSNYHSWQYLKRNDKYRKQLGRLHNYTVEQLFSVMIPKLFPLSDELERSVRHLLRKPAESTREKLVCAHIRMGKNPTNPLENLVFMDITEAILILKFLEQIAENSRTSFFVASDSDEVRDLAEQKFRDKNISTPGNTIHIDRERFLPNACSGLRKAIIEQRMLAHCDILVTTFGDYGKMAAFIRKKQNGLFCYYNQKISPCKWEESEDTFVHIQ